MRIALGVGLLVGASFIHSANAASSVEFHPTNPGPCQVRSTTLELLSVDETVDTFTANVKVNYFGCAKGKSFEREIGTRPEKVITMLRDGFKMPWNGLAPVRIASQNLGSSTLTTLVFDKKAILGDKMTIQKIYTFVFKPEPFDDVGQYVFLWNTDLQLEAAGGSSIRLR